MWVGSAGVLPEYAMLCFSEDGDSSHLRRLSEAMGVNVHREHRTVTATHGSYQDDGLLETSSLEAKKKKKKS